MTDVRNGVPPAIDQLNNTVIWWVPTIADTTAPKAATEIGAAGSADLTYSFTTDGWTADSQQGKTTDERLTLLNTLESLDKVVVSFGNGIKYVDSVASGSAAQILKSVTSGYFVVRLNVPYTTLATAAQKVTVYPVTLGPQMRGPVNGTGKATWLQQVSVTGPPVEGVLAA